MKKLKWPLWLQVLVAMVLGFVLGMLLAPAGAGWLSEQSVEKLYPWIALPGNIFLTLIKIVVIPLVFSSIVLGIASSPDPKFLRRAALRVLPFFAGTILAGAGIGLVIALLIKPGRYIDPAMVARLMEGAKPQAHVDQDQMHIADRIVALLPSNYAKSLLEQDMLATVVMATIVGLALWWIKADAKDLLLKLAEAVQEVCLTVVGWAMKLAPIAVFALICTISMRVGFRAITSMAAYIGTVLLGLALLLAFYLLLVALWGKMSPVRFQHNVRDVQLLAFSTSSSAAVMPLSMETAEKKLGVDPSISRFVIPLGTTINMAGTALYDVVAALFLTQVFGVHLSIAALLGLVATAVGASLGTPSTPGVGIVVLASILERIGVPGSGIALIIGVDRILDMSRTTINVTGDLTTCVVMNRWLKPNEKESPSAPSGVN